MICHFGISLTITHFDRRRIDAIKTAIEPQIDFDEFRESDGELYIYGEAALSLGREEDEYASGIARTVFDANGSTCDIKIVIAYLEEVPTETFSFGREDYWKLADNADKAERTKVCKH